MKRRSRPPARSCPYLIVADGHRGVEEVPDLPQALETFCLQPQAFGVALEDGFVDEETDFLDLGDLQSLRGDPGEAGKGRKPRGEGAGNRAWLITAPRPTATASGAKPWTEHIKQQPQRTKDRHKSGSERDGAGYGVTQRSAGTRGSSQLPWQQKAASATLIKHHS